MRVFYLIDRPADDVAEVAGWFLDQWGPDSTELWLTLLGSMQQRRPLPTTFVAIEDGQLLGTASLMAYGSNVLPRYSPWLTSVYVRPGVRNRGVCAALVRRVELEARLLGFSRLFFQTSGPVEPFQKLGWHWMESTIVGAEPTKVLVRDLVSVERAA